MPVSGDIILPSQMRGGQTLEDRDLIAECLSYLAIALLNPGVSLWVFFPEYGYKQSLELEEYTPIIPFEALRLTKCSEVEVAKRTQPGFLV